MEGARKMIGESKGKPVALTLARGTDTLTLQPVVSDSGMIGITYHTDFGSYPLTAYSTGQAFRYGTSDAFEAISSNIKGLKQIFAGKEGQRIPAGPDRYREHLWRHLGLASLLGDHRIALDGAGVHEHPAHSGT